MQAPVASGPRAFQASKSAPRAVNGRVARANIVSVRAQQQQHEDAQGATSSRRALLAGLTAALGLSMVSVDRAQAGEPFLVTSGARGILAEEEEKLVQLRKEREGEARARLLAEKERLEQESRQTLEGKLCATPFGVDIVGITEAVALVGALVGGITARQRKEELERLNEQLRKINLSLRQQARAGTVYAPGLSYAPTLPKPETGAPSSNGNGAAPAAAVATIVAAPPRPKPAPSPRPAVVPAAPAPTGSPSVTLLSMEEDDMSTEQIQCRDALRAGKRLLKEKNGSAAMVRFEKALMLSKALGDKIQERRAMRGLAASARLQGQYKAAIKHLERVLEISREMKEFTGDADAYGTIADCYTDMGDLEKAAVFYDKYIETMNTTPV